MYFDSLQLELHLGALLGFKEVNTLLPPPAILPNSMVDPNNPHKDKSMAVYAPDMTGGVNSIYVYSDIGEHEYVGNNMAPLLHVIPMDRVS